MAIAEMLLDPNAKPGDFVIATNDLDDISDGSTHVKMTTTEDAKLAGIEDSATADQTGAEIQTAVVGLADADRLLIKTDAVAGEHRVLNIQRDGDGKLSVDYESVAES